MNDPLLPVLLFHVPVVAFGAGVVWAARRRPRAVAAGIGAVVAAGLALAYYGAGEAGADLEAGRAVYAVGIGVTIAAATAWLLIGPARQRRGDRVGPVGAAEWGRLLIGYLLACWLLSCVLSGVLYLATTRPGQFR